MNLNLSGSWSSDATGTQFAGNLTNSRSVGYARPVTGNTIDVPATRAVGASVMFVRSAACPSDSQYISQIGLFGAGYSEVKLQLSRCVGGLVYPECRIAGALTPTSAYAVRGTVALSAGSTYRLSCVKGPDNGTSATLAMQTGLLDPIDGSRTTVNNFTIPDTGRVSSTRHLSVANKYPLPSQSTNTDQFVGKVVKLSYCSGASTAAAQTCLDGEVPLTTTTSSTTTTSTSSSTSTTSTTSTSTTTPPPTNGVDEVKYAYGDTGETVVFSWRERTDDLVRSRFQLRVAGGRS